MRRHCQPYLQFNFCADVDCGHKEWAAHWIEGTHRRGRGTFELLKYWHWSRDRNVYKVDFANKRYIQNIYIKSRDVVTVATWFGFNTFSCWVTVNGACLASNGIDDGVVSPTAECRRAKLKLSSQRELAWNELPTRCALINQMLRKRRQRNKKKECSSEYGKINPFGKIFCWPESMQHFQSVRVCVWLCTCICACWKCI